IFVDEIQNQARGRGRERRRFHKRKQNSLKNCDPLGEDKAPENRLPFHLLCALLKLSHSFNSVAMSTAGFRIIVVLAPEVMMPKLYNLSRPEGNEIDCPQGYPLGQFSSNEARNVWAP